MPALKMCLTCGALSKGSRCPTHRKTDARGYGWQHQKSRKAELTLRPWCVLCGHNVHPQTGKCWDIGCNRCPLEWHHVSELYGGRSSMVDDRRQLLCRQCHLAQKED